MTNKYDDYANGYDDGFNDGVRDSKRNVDLLSKLGEATILLAEAIAKIEFLQVGKDRPTRTSGADLRSE